MDLAQQIFAFLIILLALSMSAVVAFFTDLRQRRTGRGPLRRIPGFEILANMVGESIEASRPLHVSIGSATIGDESTILALAGSEFIYYLTREVAIGDASPLFTVSEGAAVPLAFDTLRRAYTHENRSKQFSGFATRWYPSGKRSLAFAAALMAMQADDKLSGNVIVGRHGIELALVLDAAYRKKRRTIASSDLLEGQAVAYALADESLIGEEVFAAAGYLGKQKTPYYRNITLDWLRIATVIIILAVLGYNVLRGGS